VGYGYFVGFANLLNGMFTSKFSACVLVATLIGAILSTSKSASSQQDGLQPNTLCAKVERVIFGCLLKRPAKIVSLCASKDLTSETGYLQYRFGLPSKIELEFPKDRQDTQQKFEYTHYFRARFELHEINFTVDGVNYSVFDDYNGEEKPEVMLQGVSVNQPGTPKKEVRYLCRTKPKADYTDLEAALSSH
jgi:hypothetical protein